MPTSRARSSKGFAAISAAAIEYATKAAEAADKVDNKACAMVAHAVIGEQYLREGEAAQAAIAFEAECRPGDLLPVPTGQDRADRAAAPDCASPIGVGRVEFERYERALELARQFGDRLAEAQLYEQRARDRIDAGQGAATGEDISRAASLYETLGADAHQQRVRQLEVEPAAGRRRLNLEADRRRPRGGIVSR